jgi:WD40 repeat protein
VEEIHSIADFSTAAALDATGNWLAIGLPNSRIQLWQAGEDGLYVEMGILDTGAYYPADSLAFNPGGEILAVGVCADEPSRRITCASPVIQLWNVLQGEKIGTLDIESNNITGIAFSPDGFFLVAGTQDDVMAFWYAEDGQNFELVSGLQFSQFGGFTSLAFDPSGEVLAAGTGLGEVIMLDFETLSYYGSSFRGGAGAVTALAFSPDGMVLAFGTDGGTVSVWDLDVAHWIARACELAGRNLTLDEWDTYIKDPEYRKTCEQWPEG